MITTPGTSVFETIGVYNPQEKEIIMHVKNKVAIVTGSSRGIGAATAKMLAQHGVKTVVNYTKAKEAGEQVLEEIRQAGGTGILVKADVTDPEQVKAMVKRAEEELGPVDILVNNASISFPIVSFMEYTWEDFERKLTRELKASFLCSKAVVPGMLERGSGAIINISSGLSRHPSFGFVAHSCAKSGLDAFTRALATELGPGGISVNTVAPGLIITDATRHMPKEMHEAIRQQTPLQRLGEPEDIAAAVLFFCMDSARFITGTYLPVSGGIQMI